MNELVNQLGGGLPLLLFLFSIVLYFQSRSDQDEPTEDSAVKTPLPWNERVDLRRTYASMPLDRLVQLYCGSGLKKEARNLIAHELNGVLPKGNGTRY